MERAVWWSVLHGNMEVTFDQFWHSLQIIG